MRVWRDDGLRGRARRARAWLALAVVVSLPAATLAAEPPVLVLNDTNEPPYTTPARDGFLDLIAGEAFRRAGVGLRLVKLPAERALINADAGIEDGDLTRIAGLERKYPNLVHVPEKLIDWEFAAFGRDPAQSTSWSALRQRTVGHIRGWKIYEQQLEGAGQVVATDDPEQLFRLLDLNRIEVALYERWLGQALLQQRGIRGVRALAPALATREMFIYLHKRHAPLAPRIAAALRAIKREGLYERVYREKFAPYRKAPGP